MWISVGCGARSDLNSPAIRGDLTIDTYRAVTTPPTHGVYGSRLAIAYADTWSTNHNEQYHNTAYAYYGSQGQGGDCTNFVSQDMFAGGMTWYYANGDITDPQNWYYSGYGHDASFTWSLVDSLRQHAGLHPERFQIMTGIGSLNPGDIVQLQLEQDPSLPFNHSRFLVGYGTPPSDSGSLDRGMLVDQHTTTRYHVAWNYLTQDIRDQFIRYWRIVY